MRWRRGCPPWTCPRSCWRSTPGLPYLSDFTHVSEASSLQLSVAAVLTSEATNVGIEPIVHDGVDALSRDRLFWVEQNYVCAQTLSARPPGRLPHAHAAGAGVPDPSEPLPRSGGRLVRVPRRA
ncbi:hypothetical protein EOT10_40590 [Streptomyces antnestii]|uniref:Tn3 transposase DDE domain-containing protein n=1 Tax=Streptomyces antnestii TaxID=2494256 RepID=A0A437NX70_9ACTN|nr:hypothetical protein EOT10_40590 [Streptomyces sp. San01]